MSDAALRRTIRRCTALLLIVLGAIAAEVATIEYADGGGLVGGIAVAASVLYLLVSAFIGLLRASAPSADDEPIDGGDDGDGRGGGDDGDEERTADDSPSDRAAASGPHGPWR